MEVESVPLSLAETLPVGTALVIPRQRSKDSCYIVSQFPLTLWWATSYSKVKEEAPISGWLPNRHSSIYLREGNLYLDSFNKLYYKFNSEIVFAADETELWE